MDDWKNDGKTSLMMATFYSNLNMVDITDTDKKHAKRVWKSFEL